MRSSFVFLLWKFCKLARGSAGDVEGRVVGAVSVVACGVVILVYLLGALAVSCGLVEHGQVCVEAEVHLWWSALSARARHVVAAAAVAGLLNFGEDWAQRSRTLVLPCLRAQWGARAV